MDTFEEFLAKIDNSENKVKLRELFIHIEKDYPQLKPIIKWNQPMYLLNNTYIIGFSVAINHFAFAPESKAIDYFKDDIIKCKYSYTKNLVKINWHDEINYSLISKIIAYNINDKQDYDTFWRK